MSLFRFVPERWKERLRRRAGAVTLRGRLENLRRAGFSPARIVDAGAYRGEWARLAHEVFPTASLLLIEPQPGRGAELAALCRGWPDARLCAVAIGRDSGDVDLVLEESNSRIVDPASAAARGAVRVPIRPLAQLLAEADWSGCDLLKLDLQGHELEALAGAGDLFGRIEVIQTEVSWLRIGNVPLVAEVIAQFTGHGYRPYDVFGSNHRPLDGALWQTDILFVRDDSPLIARCSWE